MHGKSGQKRDSTMRCREIYGVRDKVVLATKVFPNHLKYDQVIEACGQSLKNLNTDYLDL